MLYEGISRPRRLATLTILILLAISSLGILYSSLYLSVFSCTNERRQGFCTFLLINPNGALLGFIIVITTIINIIAAILIAARVIYFQRYIVQTVGSERNKQYTAVVVICIESSALIIIFSILYIALASTAIPASFIFMQSLVHINVRVHTLLLISCKNLMFVCFRSYRRF